jgi:osmotically-inducible protein OsmY
VFTIDRDVAKSISHLLQTDPNLAPVSGDVTVSVDKGVVTLHGNVPSDHDRLEIIERVSKLAGVDQVEDHLRVRGLR